MIKVLNHGHVRLIDSLGSDLSVVRSARISYDAEWRTGEDAGKDEKLIDYLVKNKHTSPLESVVFTFDVKAPIFVFRQWHRHRTWCLAGDTQVEFLRPCDDKPYHLTMADLAAKWNDAPRPKRQRYARTLHEFNRERISSMRLRVRGADGELTTAHITDVWQSGIKKTYTVVAGGKSIRASIDHLFLTPDGWKPVGELTAGALVCMKCRSGHVGEKNPPDTIEMDEVWMPTGYDGYDVSDLGRIRSWWGQGARTKRSVPFIKKTTVNSSGRVVVGIAGKPVQVSSLVALAFLAPTAEHQLFVLHKNDNPLDNRACNLYWGTAKNNADDSVINGSRAKRSLMFVAIESIAPGVDEPVYDLTVDHPEHNFIANGFVVHNCFNEISARYSELPEQFYIPEVSQITTQSKDNKQMRTDEIHPKAEELQDAILSACEASFKVYRGLLLLGTPRELARGVLPVNTFSHMFATVDLHNLSHFLKLRLHEHSQYEIRVYAQAMLDLIEPIVPVTVAALKRHVL